MINLPDRLGSAAVLLYAVVSLDTESTVETFRTVVQAEAMAADVFADEPELADLLVVAEFELELCPNGGWHRSGNRERIDRGRPP